MLEHVINSKARTVVLTLTGLAVLVGALLALNSLLIQDAPRIQQPLPPRPTPLDIVDRVRAITPDASNSELTRQLDMILPIAAAATTDQLDSVYSALEILREQPNLVDTLTTRYKALSTEDFDNRMLHLRVLGEIRRSDALPVLRDVVWFPLPDSSPNHGGFSSRENEEMLQAKAVEGLAYLKNAEAFEETIKVMLEHESRVVRIAAIDAYMWNQGDSENAAERLYEVLPADYQRYIERPRFQRDNDADEFDRSVDAWLARWAKERRGRNASDTP